MTRFLEGDYQSQHWASGRLGVFVITANLSRVLSSLLWGRFADRSSRVILAVSGVIAAAAGGFAMVIGLSPQAMCSAFLSSLPLIVVGFVTAGIRLCRKTYLIDSAPAGKVRFMPLSATPFSGWSHWQGGGLGFLDHVLGVSSMMVIFVITALVGAYISSRLPEAGKLSQA
jgi:MFS family permease